MKNDLNGAGKERVTHERVYSRTFLYPCVENRLEESHREGMRRFMHEVLVTGQRQQKYDP